MENFGLFWALFGIESIKLWQLLALLSSKMVLFHFSLFVCLFFYSITYQNQKSTVRQFSISLKVMEDGSVIEQH